MNDNSPWNEEHFQDRKTNGQFKKGTSGNPRGRPPKKERSHTNRQIRSDILGLMDEIFEIKIQGKVKKVPIIVAVYWKMMQLALDGDRAMILEVVKLRRELIRELTAENFEEFRKLENNEKFLAQIEENDQFKREMEQRTNASRRKTRRL